MSSAAGLNNNLRYSKQGLALTEKFEGFREKAYRDQGGVLTIGYGHTGQLVREGDVISQADAEHLLAHDVIVAENAVKRLVTTNLFQSEFDALVDFTFNVGEGNFAKSTLLALVNADKWVEAIQEFSKWDKVAGAVNKGLARRRLAEAELFQHGIITK